MQMSVSKNIASDQLKLFWSQWLLFSSGMSCGLKKCQETFCHVSFTSRLCTFKKKIVRINLVLRKACGLAGRVILNKNVEKDGEQILLKLLMITYQIQQSM